MYLVLSDNFYPETNAIASRVYERAKYWVKWGYDVTVITSAPNFPEGKVFEGYKNKWYQVEFIDGIRVVRIKTFIAKNQGTFFRTLDFLSYIFPAFIAGFFQKKPDIIFSTSPQFFVAVTGWLLSVFLKKPFILEIADLWPASIIAVGVMKKNIFLMFCEKLELFLYNKANVIIALTQSYKDDMIRRGIQENKIHVIQNGADLGLYQPRPKDESLVKKYNLHNKFVIGYIGTFGMAHGLEHILEVALNPLHKDIVFLFVGTGVARDSLIAKVQEKKITNVVFIANQQKEQIPAHWSICDVALVHLKNEPLFKTVIPSKIFEAMAMGIPILLVAPEGEASKLITQEGIGVWVTPDNNEKLNNAIQMLKNDRMHSVYREQCIIHAKNHTREFQAQEICKVFKNTIS